jgi:hypothetical protein
MMERGRGGGSLFDEADGFGSTYSENDDNDDNNSILRSLTQHVCVRVLLSENDDHDKSLENFLHHVYLYIVS